MQYIINIHALKEQSRIINIQIRSVINCYNVYRVILLLFEGFCAWFVVFSIWTIPIIKSPFLDFMKFPSFTPVIMVLELVSWFWLISEPGLWMIIFTFPTHVLKVIQPVAFVTFLPKCWTLVRFMLSATIDTVTTSISWFESISFVSAMSTSTTTNMPTTSQRLKFFDSLLSTLYCSLWDSIQLAMPSTSSCVDVSLTSWNRFVFYCHRFQL